MTTTTADRIETTPSRGRLLATRIVAWLFAAVAGFGVVMSVMFLAGSAENGHQIHELTGLVLVGAGMGAAFVRIARRPAESPAAVQQVIAIGALGLVVPALAGTLDEFSFILLAMALIVGALAPSSIVPGRPESRPLLAGAVVSLALIPYAIGQIGAQTNAGVGDPHAEFAHYTGMATFTLVIVALAYLASTRATGWRLPGWVAGVSAVVLGASSLMFSVPSALSTPWAVVTALGGAAWLVLVEREARATGV